MGFIKNDPAKFAKLTFGILSAHFVIPPKKTTINNYPYDAIEVPFTNAIPSAIIKVLFGAPIIFLDKYNPEHFEIITISTMSGVSANCWTFINGKPRYSRIFIKNKTL